MTAAEHDTPGAQALAEAARLESAAVYGRVIPEHEPTRPASLFAALAEAELEAALARAANEQPPLEPVWDAHRAGGVA